MGRQTLTLAKVVMVVLRPAKSNGDFSVSKRDGSVYRCTRVTVGEGLVMAEGGIAGTVSVKAADLVEVNLKHEVQ